MAQVTQTDLSEFARAAREATDFCVLANLCVDHFRRHGVTMISYHHLPPPGACDYTPQITVATHGVPEAWERAYAENRYYEIDPIPRHALDAVEPFWWSEAWGFPDLSNDEQFYLDLLEAAGFGEGLAVPVFGPNGRNGYAGLGIGVDAPDAPWALVVELQCACQLGHLRYCQLLRRHTSEIVALSQREGEILRWVTRGESNADIAKRLGISLHTVDTYLRRVYLKLGVSDRVTAALRGLAVGLVS